MARTFASLWPHSGLVRLDSPPLDVKALGLGRHPPLFQDADFFQLSGVLGGCRDTLASVRTTRISWNLFAGCLPALDLASTLLQCFRGLIVDLFNLQ